MLQWDLHGLAHTPNNVESMHYIVKIASWRQQTPMYRCCMLRTAHNYLKAAFPFSRVRQYSNSAHCQVPDQTPNNMVACA